MYVPATSSPEDSSPVEWPSDGLEEEDDLISVPDRPLGLFDKDELSPETSTGDDEVLTSLDPLQLRVPLVYDLLSDHIVARLANCTVTYLHIHDDVHMHQAVLGNKPWGRGYFWPTRRGVAD